MLAYLLWLFKYPGNFWRWNTWFLFTVWFECFNMITQYLFSWIINDFCLFISCPIKVIVTFQISGTYGTLFWVKGPRKLDLFIDAFNLYFARENNQSAFLFGVHICNLQIFIRQFHCNKSCAFRFMKKNWKHCFK